MNSNTLNQTFAQRLILASAVLFAFGSLALPILAHAQDNAGYTDSGGDYGSYTASADYTYPTDTSSYTASADYTYPTDTSSYTASADYTYPTDTSSYTASADYTYPAYDAYGVYGVTDVYGNTTTDYSGVGYSYQDYGSSYSPSYSPSYGSSYSQPYIQPRTFAAPNQIAYAAPQQQQQQQQQQVRTVSSPSQPINIVNTNTNTNTNVNTVNTPSVSTVVPVYQTPVQYPVQYVYPQQTYNYPVYTPTYYPPTPSVSLSQIPYTGFDFGPIGNAMYYLALLSFAAAGAYLLVYYSGSAMSFAGKGIKSRSRAIAPVKFVQAATKVEKIVEQPVLSPIQNLPTREHMNTVDSMKLVHSVGTQAPRIVITRG